MLSMVIQLENAGTKIHTPICLTQVSSYLLPPRRLHCNNPYPSSEVHLGGHLLGPQQVTLGSPLLVIPHVN